MSLLEQRNDRLRDILADVPRRWITPLAAGIDIFGEDFYGLEHEALYYWRVAKQYKFVNVTPNGMMMPKTENELTYTAFARKFFKLMIKLGLFNQFKAWNLPAIRYKEPTLAAENAARPRASEHAHSDSWLGWDQSAVVFMIPLVGDCERNWVQFFNHPLDESWIETLPSFTCPCAMKMLSHCVGQPWDYKIGSIYPNDISCVHQTRRSEGAGMRVSAEVVGYLEYPKAGSFASHTAFSRARAFAISQGRHRFKAKLKMGEIGNYDEQGRAIDVELVDVD